MASETKHPFPAESMAPEVELEAPLAGPDAPTVIAVMVEPSELTPPPPSHTLSFNGAHSAFALTRYRTR